MEKELGTGKTTRMTEAKDQAEAVSDTERIRALEKGKRQITRRTRYFAQGCEIFCRPDTLVIRFQFVDDHRAEYSVKRMCTVLKLTRSSFYKWKARQTRHVARTCADGVLGARIAAVFDEEKACPVLNASLPR